MRLHISTQLHASAHKHNSWRRSYEEALSNKLLFSVRQQTKEYDLRGSCEWKFLQIRDRKLEGESDTLPVRAGESQWYQSECAESVSVCTEKMFDKDVNDFVFGILLRSQMTISNYKIWKHNTT